MTDRQRATPDAAQTWISGAAVARRADGFGGLGTPRLTRLRWALFSAAAVMSLAVGAPVSAAAAAADEAAASDAQSSMLAPLVVTARRIEENIQKVPLAVTALTPAMLKEQNIIDVNSLTYTAPSLTVSTDFSALGSNFAIRGLSTGVTTYFSDAPCCGVFASMPFMDVSRVQVLNGPQGTLFGRSSAAGAVLIDPQRPNLSSYGGLIDATGGDYGRVQFTGVVNIPIVEDKLAIRLAVNSNHVNGYTDLIPTGGRLDEVNNQQYRIGIEFEDGRFDNYFVAQYLNIDESATSSVLASADLNNATLNLPSFYGPFVFGAVCTQAVGFGLSPDVNSCVNQRMATLSEIKATLQSELTRLSAGGNAARSTLAPYNGLPLTNEARHSDFVDIAQFDAGEMDSSKISLKNILSFHTDTSDATGTLDGIGGLLENGAFAAGPSLGVTGSNNEIGNREIPRLGPPVLNFTEEFQVHGDTRDGLLISTFGVFFSDTVDPKNLIGTPTNYQVYAGVFTPNLGYQSSGGFQNKQITTSEALYGHMTLNLGQVGVHGLSLTAGYRYSWDYSNVETFPEIYNYPSGIISAGGPLSAIASRSHGYNYNFSIAEQATPNLMIYATLSRAYVPGGVNPVSAAAANLPAFTDVYEPETVLNKEFGIKYDFAFSGVRGRIDADAYWDDFTNIIEPFGGVVGAQSVVYYENIAAATLKGVEIQATLVPTDWLEISFGYNYNNARYTKWIGEDPYNVAQPGDPECLPTSPTGQCYLNLSNNPFELMPNQQVHATVRYKAPLDPSLGALTVSLTGYAQSRVWYDIAAQRDLQILPTQNINGLSQAPYGLLNLRADWNDIRRSGWNVGVFVNNLTNEIYATGKTPQMPTLGFSIANYGPPRMFGIEISKKFGN